MLVRVSFGWLLAVWLVSGAAGAQPKAKAPPKVPVVCVLPLKALGLGEAEATDVQGRLLKLVDQTGRFRALGVKELQKAVGRLPAGSLTPLPQLVPALGARWVLSGTLAGLGEELGLDLKLLDGATAAEVRRASVTLPGDQAARKAALEELVVELLSPERWVGSLQLEVSVDGAQVWLDGQQVASSPLPEPLGGLAPGKHILMIRKEGHGEFSKFVVVRYDQVARLEVDLASATVVGLIYDRRQPEPRPAPAAAPAPPQPEPGLSWQQTTGWTLLALGGAGLVAGGLLAWHVNDLERQTGERLWTRDQEAELQEALADGRQLRRVSTGVLAGGGGLVLLAGACFLWDFLAADEPETTVILTPAAAPGGAGLWLQGRF